MPQGNKEPEFRDKALEAARYRDARDAAATPIPADDYANATGRSLGSGEGAQANEPRRIHESEEVWEVANSAIDAAVARGDFDNLAYAGKPIPGLGGTDDPDWWVKGLLQREQVSGLGPPALMLRKEDAELEDTLDAQGAEARVREILADFNQRIIEARRQLTGGPPVITKLRDIDMEVAAWRSRAAARRAAASTQELEPEPAPDRGRGFFARLFGRR